jgi:hypothetical protein
MTQSANLAALGSSATSSGGLNLLNLGSSGITFSDSTTQNTAGTVSKASPGYTKLPNGLIIQWGTTAFNGSGSASITFPIAFPTAFLWINASISRGSTLAGYLMSTQIGATSTTGATIIGNYTTGGSVTNLTSNEAAAWLAIGY